MPICYETYVDSNGCEFSTGNIAYTYRNYYGPSKNFDELEEFSMNITKENLDFFQKYTKCKIEYEVVPDYCITLNYNKENNLCIITGPGNFRHKEICFNENFLKVIGFSYRDSLNLSILD
jgi:hypothetical protein